MVSGYLYMPDESAALNTDDGWIRTGDLGAVDKDGFLSITGRKKDLLITAGGENVAPAEMENHLQGILGVGQAVVVGDRQPYLCAILALEEETLPDLCKAAGVPVAPLAEIASNEKVRAFLANCVESDCNSKVARFQTIKKFEVLPHMLSVAGSCYDNAAIESFFSLLKRERVSRVRYRTREEARSDVFDYIERFYNRQRSHSYLGYTSPVQFERQAMGT